MSYSTPLPVYYRLHLKYPTYAKCNPSYCNRLEISGTQNLTFALLGDGKIDNIVNDAKQIPS